MEEKCVHWSIYLDKKQSVSRDIFDVQVVIQFNISLVSKRNNPERKFYMANFRWRKKQQFQERDIARQKVLLQDIDTRRQKFLENYNKKINKEAAKMKSNAMRKD